MYLKRLEINGFKSFADKTKVELKEGINAVVGPNGSGKSNISDAVLWVLGEQNARILRGSRMEDVIFSGSDKRKVKGLAEVNLILDNSDGTFPLDYSEVSIKRRLYRTGDSEYFINKTPCRLKDIHELLVDTGFGRDAFSHIGQGRIDEILSVKPEERRTVVDDAAGLIKYKNRKKEAHKKLDETKKSIVRVEDILIELESQLEPLAQQADKAKEYLKLKEEIDELEISKTVWLIHNLKSELTEKQKKHDLLVDEITEMEARTASVESSLEKKQLKIQTLDREIREKQMNLQEKKSRLERCEGDLRYSQRQQEDLKKSFHNTAAEIDSLEQEKEETAIAYAGEKEKMKEVTTSLEELLEESEQENQKYTAVIEEITQKGKSLEEKKSFLIDIMNQLADASHKMRMKEAELDRNENELEKRGLEKKQALQEMETLLERKQDLESQKERAAERKNEKEQSLKRADKEKENVLASIKNHDQETSDLQDKIRQMESRLNALEEMSKGYEGYHKGVRSVLLGLRKKAFDGEGICGVVSELIHVEKEFEAAISTALGGSLQNIVTETANDAMKAIDHLKESKGGRCTFLPLESIGAKPRTDTFQRISSEKGYIGVAADLVVFEEKYQAVLEHLLGNIAVFSNLRDASKAAKKANHRLRIVTVDGDMISSGGAMSGGSQSSFQMGLLGRSREIKTLKKKINQKTQDIENRSERKEAYVGRLDIAEERIRELSDALKQGEIQRAEISKEFEQIEYERKRLAKQLNTIEHEVKLLQENMDSAAQEREVLKREQNMKNQLKEETNREIEKLTDTLSEEETIKENMSAKVTDSRVEIASIEQKKQNMNEQVQMFEKMLAKHENRLEKLQIDKKKAQEDLTLTEKEQTSLKDQRDALLSERTTAEKDLKDQEEDRDSLAQNLEEEEKELKKVRKKANRAKEKCHALDIDITRQDIEIRNQSEKLCNEYSLDTENLNGQTCKPIDLSKTEERIGSLRKQMDNLGDVQLSAVEEQKRVLSRFDFLNRQFDDLKEAQADLHQVIEDIDKVMKKKFWETFEQIRIHFNEVFARLFDGGSADLVLAEPADPLESGLDIKVQPPGKKLQNLTLMSGGEKALTAISLLFAVLKTRPTSFCVLDEIDTSLDESNVERFSRFLRELTDPTQFIVVTHRKGTMETADVMYGVTMEEAGVSKMISVKFSHQAVS